MASKGAQGPLLRWAPLTGGGPLLTNHAGCVVNGHMYVHGGVSQNRSTMPVNVLQRFSLGGEIWENLTCDASPALSHHAAVSLQDRYLLIVGGWTGHERSSEVWAYDTADKRWLSVPSSGFPEGAGLSSHTATALDDGRVMVIGREGSLREQRRSGNSFLLVGSVSKGFKYECYPVTTASRSGHTTTVQGNKLVVLGGRDDKLLEGHTGWRAPLHPLPFIQTLVEKLQAAGVKPLAKTPGGRKNHITVGSKGVLLIHGGETFDGRSRGPVAEMLLLDLPAGLQWYKVPVMPLNRAAHVVWVHEGQVYVHGGIDGSNTVTGLVHKLELCETGLFKRVS